MLFSRAPPKLPLSRYDSIFGIDSTDYDEAMSMASEDSVPMLDDLEMAAVIRRLSEAMPLLPPSPLLLSPPLMPSFDRAVERLRVSVRQQQQQQQRVIAILQKRGNCGHLSVYYFFDMGQRGMPPRPG